MAFWVINEYGDQIVSLDFEDNEWEILKKDKAYKSTLKMPCCDSRVILKTSVNKYPFFAHYGKKCPNYSPESKEHQMLKVFVYRMLKSENYNVYIEHVLNLNEGIRRPDVYMEYGDLKIAFEIQNTQQSMEKIKERSLQYTQNNILCIWLNLFELKRVYLYRSKFNLDNVFIYEVKNKDDDYIIGDIHTYSTCNLKDFLLEKLAETFKPIDYELISNNINKLIAKTYSNQYILQTYDFEDGSNVTKLGNNIITKADTDRIIRPTFSIKKGFLTTSKIFSFFVEKKDIEIIDDSHQCIPKIGYIQKKQYRELNYSKLRKNSLDVDGFRSNYLKIVADILSKMGWSADISIVIDKKYRIDVLGKLEKNKIAFLTLFFNDPDISKTINYCKENNISVVILNYYCDIYYSNITTIDCIESDFENCITEEIFKAHCPF